MYVRLLVAGHLAVPSSSYKDTRPSGLGSALNGLSLITPVKALSPNPVTLEEAGGWDFNM